VDKPFYAEPGHARIHALRLAWPIKCRRLEENPNINAAQLFEELCIQFPGRFTRKQHKTFTRKVSEWREHARARGVVIGPKTYVALATSPAVDDLTRSAVTGARWLNALRRIRTRRHWSSASSSRRATPANKAHCSSTRWIDGCEFGVNMP
jgi:hypothetical protein